MLTSDFRPFRARIIHLAIIIETVRSLCMDEVMGQIRRSTERISSNKIKRKIHEHSWNDADHIAGS